MEDINIKIARLTDVINELKGLKQYCESGKKSPPSTVGGGRTVNKLEEIGELYPALNSHLSQMIGSTISFLQSAKDGFQTSDANAAAKIKN